MQPLRHTKPQPHSASPARARPGRLHDQLHFLRAIMANPMGVGAISPSSKALAAAITAELNLDGGRILELGSGTGVFAQHLVTQGFNPAELVLVEQDPGLAQTLRARFPAATVLQVPAQALNAGPHANLTDIGAAICGLPLRNMGHALQRQILEAVFEVMHPTGTLHLFTYGLRCPISHELLTTCGLRASRTSFVIRNIPPASVYRLSRSTLATCHAA